MIITKGIAIKPKDCCIIVEYADTDTGKKRHRRIYLREAISKYMSIVSKKEAINKIIHGIIEKLHKRYVRNVDRSVFEMLINRLIDSETGEPILATDHKQTKEVGESSGELVQPSTQMMHSEKAELSSSIPEEESSAKRTTRNRDDQFGDTYADDEDSYNHHHEYNDEYNFNGEEEFQDGYDNFDEEFDEDYLDDDGGEFGEDIYDEEFEQGATYDGEEQPDSNEQDAGESGDPTEEDLNRVSESELGAAKSRMNIEFEKNRINRDDPQYEYDVQRDFNPTESSGWDSDD